MPYDRSLLSYDRSLLTHPHSCAIASPRQEVVDEMWLSMPYDRSVLPYDRSLLPYDRSLLPYDRPLLPYDIPLVLSYDIPLDEMLVVAGMHTHTGREHVYFRESRRRSWTHAVDTL